MIKWGLERKKPRMLKSSPDKKFFRESYLSNKLFRGINYNYSSEVHEDFSDFKQ